MALAQAVQFANGLQATALPRILSAYLSWTDTSQLAAAGLPNFAEMHFDAVISEEHEHASEVTEHTVEQGVNVVDHVRPLARRVTLEVFVSNTPVGSRDAQRAPIQFAVAVPNGATTPSLGTITVPQPHQDGFLAFLNGGTSQVLGGVLQAVGLVQGNVTSYTPQTAAAPPYQDNINFNVDQFIGASDYPLQAFDNLEVLRTTATLLNVNTPKAYYTDMVLESVKMSRSQKAGTGAYFTLMFREIRFVNSSVVNAPAPSIPSAAQTVNKGKTDVKPPPTGLSSLLSFGMHKRRHDPPNLVPESVRMAAQQIPTDLNLRFWTQITVLDGVPYLLTFQYNDRESAYYLSIGSSDGTTNYVVGMKLVVGYPLMQPFGSQPPGEIFVVSASTANDGPPAIGELGDNQRCVLIYVPEADLFSTIPENEPPRFAGFLV